MTEVGVHHADDVRGRDAETGDDGRAEPELAGAVNDLHPPRARELVGDRAGAVRRVVVDDHELELDAVLAAGVEERRRPVPPADRARCRSARPSSDRPAGTTSREHYNSSVQTNAKRSADDHSGPSPQSSRDLARRDFFARAVVTIPIAAPRSAGAGIRARRAVPNLAGDPPARVGIVLARRGAVGPQRTQQGALGRVGDRQLESGLHRAGVHRARVRGVRGVRRRHLAGAGRAGRIGAVRRGLSHGGADGAVGGRRPR